PRQPWPAPARRKHRALRDQPEDGGRNEKLDRPATDRPEGTQTPGGADGRRLARVGGRREPQTLADYLDEGRMACCPLRLLWGHDITIYRALMSFVSGQLCCLYPTTPGHEDPRRILPSTER